MAQENKMKERKLSHRELPLCSEYLAKTAEITQLKLALADVRSAIQECKIREMEARNALPEIKMRMDAAEKGAREVAKKLGLPENVVLQYDAQKRAILYREIEDRGMKKKTPGSSGKRGSAKRKDSGTNGESEPTASSSSKKKRKRTRKPKDGNSTKTS